MMNNILKHLHVTCAIIEHDGLVLAAQRSASMSMPLKWEFPGGKIRAEETPKACLIREIHEEMGVLVHIRKVLEPATHLYPDFLITLYPFICAIETIRIVLHEHAAIRWFACEDLHKLDWTEADIPVLNAYLKERMNDGTHKQKTSGDGNTSSEA